MSALPKFVPSPMVDHRYEVTLMASKWDQDEGKFKTTVTAIGPVGARKAAEDKHRDEYPDCVAVWVEEVVADSDFHVPGCGQRWDFHDNSDPLAKLPFGCLPEWVARQRAGDM